MIEASMTFSSSISEMHIEAKRMNNSAALFIVNGHHKKAIRQLTGALQLCRDYYNRQQQENECFHDSATLDDNNFFSGENEFRGESCVPHCASKGEESNFVYDQPIRISHLRRDGSVTPSFFLVITFNLALAHHLGAKSDVTTKSSYGTEKTDDCIKDDIEKAIRLYELVIRHNLQLSYESPEPELGEEESFNCSSHANGLAGTNRMTMIACNNLAHAYYLNKNHKKSKQWMECLLSIVMLTLDTTTRLHTNNSYDEERVETNNARSHSRESFENQWRHELDGYLRNTSSLFLDLHCAGAA